MDKLSSSAYLTISNLDFLYFSNAASSKDFVGLTTTFNNNHNISWTAESQPNASGLLLRPTYQLIPPQPHPQTLNPSMVNSAPCIFCGGETWLCNRRLNWLGPTCNQWYCRNCQFTRCPHLRLLCWYCGVRNRVQRCPDCGWVTAGTTTLEHVLTLAAIFSEDHNTSVSQIEVDMRKDLVYWRNFRFAIVLVDHAVASDGLEGGGGMLCGICLHYLRRLERCYWLRMGKIGCSVRQLKMHEASVKLLFG
jgi:hypothetical protein